MTHINITLLSIIFQVASSLWFPTCSPHTFHSPTHVILLYLNSLIIFSKKYISWSTSVYNFLNCPITSSLSGPDIFIRILFSPTPTTCVLPLRSETMFYICMKQLAKIINYVISSSGNKQQEVNVSDWTSPESPKFNRLLIFSCMRYRFSITLSIIFITHKKSCMITPGIKRRILLHKRIKLGMF